MKSFSYLFFLGWALLTWSACSTNNGTEVAGKEVSRIVTLQGTLTEIIFELGLGDKVVGTDVTSNYPESVASLPKVSHSRNISSEGVLSLNPGYVIGFETSMTPETRQQIESAGVPVKLFKESFSIEGSKKLIREVAETFGANEKAEAICSKIDQDLQAAPALNSKPKVLFIYARGAGTLMVAGKNTAAQAMIELAGATNAFYEFEDFKPLTPESLVSANPDVILLFTSGLESLGGIDGLLAIQGIAQTTAGKEKRVIEMDGPLLTGFGPRVGQAVTELAEKLNAIAP